MVGTKEHAFLNSRFWIDKILNSRFWKTKILNSRFCTAKIMNSRFWMAKRGPGADKTQDGGDGGWRRYAYEYKLPLNI